MIHAIGAVVLIVFGFLMSIIVILIAEHWFRDYCPRWLKIPIVTSIFGFLIWGILFLIIVGNENAGKSGELKLERQMIANLVIRKDMIAITGRIPTLSSEVRIETYKALAKIGGEEANKVLITALFNNDISVQKEAEQALHEMPSHFWRNLLKEVALSRIDNSPFLKKIYEPIKQEDYLQQKHIEERERNNYFQAINAYLSEIISFSLSITESGNAYCEKPNSSIKGKFLILTLNSLIAKGIDKELKRFLYRAYPCGLSKEDMAEFPISLWPTIKEDLSTIVAVYPLGEVVGSYHHGLFSPSYVKAVKVDYKIFVIDFKKKEIIGCETLYGHSSFPEKIGVSETLGEYIQSAPDIKWWINKQIVNIR